MEESNRQTALMLTVADQGFGNPASKVNTDTLYWSVLNMPKF